MGYTEVEWTYIVPDGTIGGVVAGSISGDSGGTVASASLQTATATNP